MHFKFVYCLIFYYFPVVSFLKKKGKKTARLFTQALAEHSSMHTRMHFTVFDMRRDQFSTQILSPYVCLCVYIVSQRKHCLPRVKSLSNPIQQ